MDLEKIIEILNILDKSGEISQLKLLKLSSINSYPIVQKYIKYLEKKGFVVVKKQGASNIVEITGYGKNFLKFFK